MIVKIFVMLGVHLFLVAGAIVGLVIAFHFRARIIERIHTHSFRRGWHRLSLNDPSGFQGDLEAGFSSNQFDLRDNIMNDDPRSLDENAKREIQHLMAQDNISFDKARLKYFRDKLAEHNIGADGVPRDKKAVTF